jgi:exodeoxyribonuclease VII large subunit
VKSVVPVKAAESQAVSEAVEPESQAESVAVEESNVPWSVTEFTRRVKRWLEDRFVRVRVRGEISNLRIQGSGHAYFVLKDAGAQLSCVLFRGLPGVDRSLLKDGLGVVLSGDITVYEPRGQYQLRVVALELEGEGALQAAFERLKKKLAAEGLFETSRKRPIPEYPKRIGIVTSPTGAALRDVLHVLGRRYAGLEIVLAPARVQGAGAAEEIARAVERLNRLEGAQAVDVLLVTRGGGSLEDLWAFNEEVLARALAASQLPVISAVGHEIDFTIADFVSDLRAATPSAAAEILTAQYVASRKFIGEVQTRLRRCCLQGVSLAKARLQDGERRLLRMHPRRLLERSSQQLDESTLRLFRSARRGLRDQGQQVNALQQRLFRWQPRVRLQAHQQALEQTQGRWSYLIRLRLNEKRRALDRPRSALNLLSPLKVIERGYSITFTSNGHVIRKITDAKPGEALRTRVADGDIVSVVQEPTTDAS